METQNHSFGCILGSNFYTVSFTELTGGEVIAVQMEPDVTPIDGKSVDLRNRAIDACHQYLVDYPEKTLAFKSQI